MASGKLQGLGLPATDYSRLEQEFSDIILQMVQVNGSMVKPIHHIKFKNGYYMEAEEVIILSNREIGLYYYNLYDSNGQAILKFHSERHSDRRYQTNTEPFHIHKPPSVELSTMDRMDNNYHQDLYSILESLQILFVVLEHQNNTVQKEVEESKKK
ncbi:toxin-antitoxin system TumE family protein [Bacillus rhizoplanae]|uniref:toxin-antitoxin system TumE family protein n=1 Tax=Bacillus rhizoplanae TaxID=2880966 RepID=UPI003D1DF57B